MKIPFGDLSRQYKKYKNEFDSIITSVLEKGNFILGENLAEFERNFASYLGVKHGIGVANGTEAIFLSLKALDIGSGDEVITVANTAVPTVSAIDFAGATPVFVDIDDSFNINPKLIEEKITDKTKAIIPVHLYGNPCEINNIMQVAKKYDLKVIEDCAQAHGAEYKGKKVGTFGDLSAFSFYPSKNLGANGDGGMVVTENDELAQKVRLLRNYGFKDRYNSILRGYNSRLDEIQAALLKFKLTKLDLWNERRGEIAQKYEEALKYLPLKLPVVLHDVKPVFHLFVIKLENQNLRDSFIKYLAEREITALIHYPIPIHLQPAYKFLGYKLGDLPVTEKISGQILSIPIFPELEGTEVDYVIKMIKSFFISK